MRFFAVALFLFGAAASYAQAPEVPHKMRFADLTLIIRDDARREIQKDVDALTRHTHYFEEKADRARMYFPIIEKIFSEENVPDDFKFLVLQESALIANAVSVSNAVGFWQFKDFTALEMGMRIDRQVDERMNLVSSTRAAARYLKQNNTIFNNWIYALQSYQMGAGGVKKVIGDKYNGDRDVEITSDTYWYVRKFIAHKVAFEQTVGGEPKVFVSVLQDSQGKTVNDLAAETQVEEELLLQYNVWIKGNSVPDDKAYSLIIPGKRSSQDFNRLVINSGKASKAIPRKGGLHAVTLESKLINGVPAIIAQSGENVTSLAEKAGVTLSKFLKYNDISIDHQIEPGHYYFLKKKRNKGSFSSHEVKLNEDLWSVSQYYGVKLNKLEKYNGIDRHGILKVGSVVWLNVSGQNHESSPEGDKKPVAELETQVFTWENTSKQDQAIMNPVKVEETLKKVEPVASTEHEPSTLSTVVVDTIKEVASNIEMVDYPVKKGDTYYSISKAFSMEVIALLQVNQLEMSTPLKPGQVIKVNAGKPLSVEKEVVVSADSGKVIIHEVRNSDTLYSVARQYSVTIKELLDWNHKTDFSILLGEKLKIMRR